jgi:hypothetical protein
VSATAHARGVSRPVFSIIAIAETLAAAAVGLLATLLVADQAEIAVGGSG